MKVLLWNNILFLWIFSKDCTRKESENIANAAIFKEKYLNECKHMGVKVRQNFLVLVFHLALVSLKSAGTPRIDK